MNSERKILASLALEVNNIRYQKSVKILNTDHGEYTSKIKKNNNEEIYNYLESRNFSNYLHPLTTKKDSYEIYPYIAEREISPSDKALNLIYTMSLLHNKTTTYEDVNLDSIKALYEEYTEKITTLKKQYLDLQDYIENKVFMSPAEYLLIRNVSSIYYALDKSKEKLDLWYEHKKTQKRERHVLLHNNISLEHFLSSENDYFINWDHSAKGIVVYDFLKFFQNNYDDLEMQSLFELYQSKYRYSPDELLLFESLILIPWKISFKDSNLANTIRVRKLLNYVLKSLQFVSENDKENEKAQQ